MTGQNKNSICCETKCRCSGDRDRSKHLCMLTKPSNNFDVNKIKKLVNNPKFICTCCGRAANEEKNLCNPVPLPL